MIRNWDEASNYLSRGRKKYVRPLYDRGLRIWKENRWDADSPISLGWMFSGNTNTFVTYYKDGTTSISGSNQTTHWGGHWYPLRSQSVRLTIQRYAGIMVFQRNFKFFLQEEDATLSAPKIQGCRKCSQSGLVDGWCYATTCYDGEQGQDGRMYCNTHPDAVFIGQQYQYRWHRTPCQHGLEDHHEVKKSIVCGSCNGTKKRDYGSKPERTVWDGSPLRLRDGKLIKAAASLLERMVADYAEPIS